VTGAAAGEAKIKILRNVRILMRDGIELSADLWFPSLEGASPAILEVLPYRKDDYHRTADDALMSAVARRGYVGCRLDVRGTGRSAGIAADEYAEDETLDMLEVISWLRQQPWSNGRVAAWGWSYGGFTSLMAAARRPEGLVAIVPCYASDDRWEDDVHQIGGLRTASDQFGYAASMIGMNAMPGGIELDRPEWRRARLVPRGSVWRWRGSTASAHRHRQPNRPRRPNARRPPTQSSQSSGTYRVHAHPRASPPSGQGSGSPIDSHRQLAPRRSPCTCCVAAR